MSKMSAAPLHHLACKAFAALLLMMEAVATAGAASFDCTRATSFAEQRVCQDFDLSRLDDQLAQHFKAAMEEAADPASLRRAQVQWLRQSRDACTDDACLDQAYRMRLAELEPPPAPAEQHPEPGQGAETAASTEQPVTEAPALPGPAESIVSQPLPASNSTAATTHTPDFAGTPASAAASMQSSNSGGDTKTIRVVTKVLLVLIVLNAVFAIYLHRKGALTIYEDYTDATFTSIGPLVAFVVYLICQFLELEDEISVGAALTVLALFVIFVVKATIQANGLSLRAAVALLAKGAFVAGYYALMAMILATRSGRRQGETRRSYDARMRRESREATARAGLLTAGFVALSMLVCRSDEFTPLSRYLALRRPTP